MFPSENSWANPNKEKTQDELKRLKRNSDTLLEEDSVLNDQPNSDYSSVTNDGNGQIFRPDGVYNYQNSGIIHTTSFYSLRISNFYDNLSLTPFSMGITLRINFFG